MNENGSTGLIPSAQGSGVIARQEFAAQEIDSTNNATAQALATQARAEVEARIIAARRWPRDLDTVRVKVLASCRRPRFAEVAWYRKPQGKKPDGSQNFVEGLSVRFAEEAARQMGNLYTGSLVLFDDERQRVLRVYAVDLETNTSRDEIVTVTKTVERKRLGKGQQAIRTRTNSYGDPVHIVEATDDEVMQKQGILVQKAWRNLVLRLVPGDIADECRDQILATRTNETATDPDAARKRIADAFASIGVTPVMLREVLGHELAACSPVEIESLRGYFAAIKSGETTWKEIAEQAQQEAAETKPPAKSTADLAAARKKKGDEVKCTGSIDTHEKRDGETLYCADPGCILRGPSQ